MIDIDKLAEQVGMVKDGDHWFSLGSDDFDVKHEHLVAFAKLVIANNPPQSFMSWQEGYAAGAAAERAECLELAKSYAHNNTDLHSAIRARGQA
jgi:hypothetical protein